MTCIYLSVDPGKSAIKVLYQIDKKQTRYLLLPPNIVELPKQQINNFLESNKSLFNKPENRAWIEVNNKYFAVGFLATQFYVHDQIKKKKYESAIYKILCTIGIIVDKHDLWEQEINVSIITALPTKEFNDKTSLTNQIKALITDFQFGGRQMSLNLELKHFICCREGQGLAMTVATQRKQDWLETQNFACLNIGHYNLSALCYKSGEPIFAASPPLGFANLVDQIIALTSNLDRKVVTDAIWKILSNEHSQTYSQSIKKIAHPNWEEQASIRSLATATDSTLKKAEIKQIADAINNVTEDFWSNRIVPWLNEVASVPLNEVFITGGAASFFEPELEDYFSCYSKFKEEGYNKWVKTGEYRREYSNNRRFVQITWNAGIEEEIQKILKFNKAENQAQSLTNRFLDCFGLFNYLLYEVSLEQRLATKKSQSGGNKKENAPV